MKTPRVRTAFTLIELLIVVFLISLLIQMLLPAVQSAREAARKTQCRNHLRQIAMACQMHHNTHNRFPSGGWYHRWVGEPERGTGIDQPGGWVFNILGYIEADHIRSLGKGLKSEERADVIAQRCATPIALLNCPSRRSALAYPQTDNFRPFTRDGEFPFDLLEGTKSDYAANSGSAYGTASFFGLTWSGPTSLDEGDSMALWPGDEGFEDESGKKPLFDGIIYGHSQVSLRKITDGASKTYLIGEKYVHLDHYETGLDFGDNENMYYGFNDDTCRTARGPPSADRPKHSKNIFGSAHPSGWNVAFADGSVREISYDMYLQVHRSLASRDGEETLSIGSTQ